MAAKSRTGVGMAASFSEFLKSRALIPFDQIPQFERWVRMYSSRRPGTEGDKTGGASMNEFLAEIGTSHGPLKVAQARKALQLYSYFRSIGSGQFDFKAGHTVRSSGGWQGALIKSLVRVVRAKNLSARTEQAYCGWAERFLSFSRYRAGRSLNENDIKAYLSYLAVDRKVAAATYQQASIALQFLCSQVLHVPVGSMEAVICPKESRSMPVVLSVEEVRRLLACLKSIDRLVATLMYGAGLRLEECLSLRVQDVDFQRPCLTVRGARGKKDRTTLLPEKLGRELATHLRQVRVVYDSDRARGFRGVPAPVASTTGKADEWGLFWVFPSERLSIDQGTGQATRYHIYPGTFQRSFKNAALAAGIARHPTVHTLRHSFAAHLVERGCDIRTIQELLGHSDVSTTMVYARVARRNKLKVSSPADFL